MTVVNDLNQRLSAVVAQHEYRGFACRFTGLKGAREDSELVGQLIATMRGGPRFVVVVPSGYVGPFDVGDHFYCGNGIPLDDICDDFDGTITRLTVMLDRRVKMLHRLVDQHLDGAGKE